VRDELAERALARIMGWDEDETEKIRGIVADLQALARLKYDEYGMFKPGVKFLESLVRWLTQFGEAAERETALRFVREELLFISFPEIDHLISTVYPDHIRMAMVERVAAEEGIAPYRVYDIASSDRFRELERRTLILGLSDGARLDQLRRASPRLSTEQFHLTYWINDEIMEDRREALKEALDQHHISAPDTFAQLVLIDDFSGSGFSMLRSEDGGSLKGKLWKIHDHLIELAEHFDDALEVLIVIYVATAQARRYLRNLMDESGLAGWNLRVAMPLDDAVRVSLSFPDIVPLCNTYYDPLLKDKHKRDHVPLGYERCELPLILHHNTPNNSVCLLWGDTTDRDDAKPLCALFPRFERHHEDRP
jgi:hypothetical protein